jgi:hypothetical protein
MKQNKTQKTFNFLIQNAKKTCFFFNLLKKFNEVEEILIFNLLFMRSRLCIFKKRTCKKRRRWW